MTLTRKESLRLTSEATNIPPNKVRLGERWLVRNDGTEIQLDDDGHPILGTERPDEELPHDR